MGASVINDDILIVSQRLYVKSFDFLFVHRVDNAAHGLLLRLCGEKMHYSR